MSVFNESILYLLYAAKYQHLLLIACACFQDLYEAIWKIIYFSSSADLTATRLRTLNNVFKSPHSSLCDDET